MKTAFALKAASLASAVVCASSWAQATGDFVFSNNLLGGYSLISATVGNVAPATLLVGTDDAAGDITGTPFATYSAGASAPVTSITLDAGNDIVSIVSQGGVFQDAPKSTAATGGHLIINNLTYDAATNIISADVSGNNLAGTYNLATTHEQVFTIKALDYSTDGGATWTPIADPTSFPVNPAGGFEIRSSGLFLVGGNTGTVFSQFQQSLGLKGIGLSTLQALDTYDAATNTAGFGTLTVKVPAIPEPSSYAMMALGLAGVGLAVRRGRKQG
jgi:hypothetical protein